MPIELVVQKLYYWMKEYSTNHIIRDENIKLWAKQNKVTPQDKGYAIQLLKNAGYIMWRGPKYGWLVK